MSLEEEIKSLRRIAEFHRPVKGEDRLVRFFTWTDVKRNGENYALDGFNVSLKLAYAIERAQACGGGCFEGYVEANEIVESYAGRRVLKLAGRNKVQIRLLVDYSST